VSASKTRCIKCQITIVRIVGEECAGCRDSLTQESQMDPAEPRRIVETQLRQLAYTQALTQNILDNPRSLLCSACHESPLATEQVDVVLALDAMVKQSKVLAGVIPNWVKLVDASRDAVANMSREELMSVFVTWFNKLPGAMQRETLQEMTRSYNDHPQRAWEGK